MGGCVRLTLLTLLAPEMTCLNFKSQQVKTVGGIGEKLSVRGQLRVW